MSISVKGSNVFIDQATDGPGTTPIEGPGFAAGDPLSPMTPYDWFTGAPVTPGVSGIGQYTFTGTYRTPRLRASADIGLTAIDGDVQNASYWGEPLYEPIDPHGGRSFINAPIVFPTHAGMHDVFAGELVVPLRVSLGAADDNWRLRAGYLDLAQSDRFIFAAPPVTNVTPSTGVQLAETLGPGMPSIDAWDASPTTLQLHGFDGIAKRGNASLELTDALLPALPATAAHLFNASFVLDRGDAGRYSAQVVHVRTSGDAIGTTTLYGVGATIAPGPQGMLPTSTLADQRQTIVGVRAFVHPARGDDALVELGRAWYDAGLVARPGTARPGDYVHVNLTRHLTSDDALGVDYYRFDPRYATIILPYGMAENIWSVAWSWPGAWLKSTYQLVDNSAVGINRAGYRFKADHKRGRLEAHASYARYVQIEPITTDVASQVGWVDGFYLPQLPGSGTQGWMTQIGAWAGWHLERDDLAVDFVEDTQHRGYLGGHAVDLVNMRDPQLVASLTHHFSKNGIGVIGYGRYGAYGTFSITPVDAIYGVGWAAWQQATGEHTAFLVQLRRYATSGLPSMTGGPPPTLHGTALIVEQRLSY